MNDGEIVYENGWHIISNKQNLCAFYLTKTLQETEQYFVGVRIKTPTQEKTPVLLFTHLSVTPSAIFLDKLSKCVMGDWLCREKKTSNGVTLASSLLSHLKILWAYDRACKNQTEHLVKHEYTSNILFNSRTSLLA